VRGLQVGWRWCFQVGANITSDQCTSLVDTPVNEQRHGSYPGYSTGTKKSTRTEDTRK